MAVTQPVGAGQDALTQAENWEGKTQALSLRAGNLGIVLHFPRSKPENTSAPRCSMKIVFPGKFVWETDACQCIKGSGKACIRIDLILSNTMLPSVCDHGTLLMSHITWNAI